MNDQQADYDALRKAYLENGKNPFTNTPLDWSTVVRLMEEIPSPHETGITIPD